MGQWPFAHHAEGRLVRQSVNPHWNVVVEARGAPIARQSRLRDIQRASGGDQAPRPRAGDFDHHPRGGQFDANDQGGRGPAGDGAQRPLTSAAGPVSIQAAGSIQDKRKRP